MSWGLKQRNIRFSIASHLLYWSWRSVTEETGATSPVLHPSVPHHHHKIRKNQIRNFFWKKGNCSASFESILFLTQFTDSLTTFLEPVFCAIICLFSSIFKIVAISIKWTEEKQRGETGQWEGPNLIQFWIHKVHSQGYQGKLTPLTLYYSCPSLLLWS